MLMYTFNVPGKGTKNNRIQTLKKAAGQDLKNNPSDKPVCCT